MATLSRFLGLEYFREVLIIYFICLPFPSFRGILALCSLLFFQEVQYEMELQSLDVMSGISAY